MGRAVLDSFAVLALVFGEKGHEKVVAVLEKAARSGESLLLASPNWAEVRYMIERKAGATRWPEVRGKLAALPVKVVAVDQDLAEKAGAIKAQHKLSLADAFAAALAIANDADIYTGDPEFKSVEKLVRVVWL